MSECKTAAKKALSEKIRALAAQDTEAATLKVTLDALDKEIAELRAKARKLKRAADK